MNPTTIPAPRQFTQNVIVMRHGDRKDNFEPLWVSTAKRPWDPPLIEAGNARAFTKGKKLKSIYDFQIHRAFVSPFLRCIQTASQVVSALANTDNTDGSIKVSIEFGLCEMLNNEAIRPESAPKDGKFEFDIPELEKVSAVGSFYDAEPIYENLPEWGETRSGTRERYLKVIERLADKYPNENLLLVTHGEAVGVAFSAFMKDVIVYEVDYCAHVHLKRNVVVDENEKVRGERFEVLEHEGQTGVGYCPLSALGDK